MVDKILAHRKHVNYNYYILYTSGVCDYEIKIYSNAYLCKKQFVFSLLSRSNWRRRTATTNYAESKALVCRRWKRDFFFISDLYRMQKCVSEIKWKISIYMNQSLLINWTFVGAVKCILNVKCNFFLIYHNFNIKIQCAKLKERHFICFEIIFIPKIGKRTWQVRNLSDQLI